MSNTANEKTVRCPQCGQMVGWRYRINHECCKTFLLDVRVKESLLYQAEYTGYHDELTTIR